MRPMNSGSTFSIRQILGMEAVRFHYVNDFSVNRCNVTRSDVNSYLFSLFWNFSLERFFARGVRSVVNEGPDAHGYSEWIPG